MLPALGDLTPFAASGGCAAAAAALRSLTADGSAVVLAFALLPSVVDVLFVPTEGLTGEAVLRRLRERLTRRVNRVLARSGPLLGRAALHTCDPREDWVPLAEAIEARPVAEGLAAEPADCLASSAHPSHAEWVRQAAGAAPARPSAGPAPAGQRPLTIGDVVRVAAVPTVVQLADAVELDTRLAGTPDEAQLERLRDYVARWFLDDRRTLAVARSVLAGLGRTESGAGWFVTGLFGSGKSHLLAVLALVAGQAVARDELFRAQPALVDLRAGLDRVGDRLVVAVALDEAAPAAGLEEAVFAAAEAALLRRLGEAVPLAEPSYVIETVRAHLLSAHQPALDAAAGGDWSGLADEQPEQAARLAVGVVRELGLPYRFTQTRVERLGRLLETARQAGLGGVVLLLDELAVFLRSRDRAGLHADAAFLQFLGQRTALGPLWVVAALQRQIEDVGEIEHYTLRQIQDRFETRLALPLSAARQVLARKVLPRRSPEALEAAVEAAWRTWSGGSRRGDVTVARLRESYPLHPLTAVALEACAERFLSRTRSLIEFAVAHVAGDELTPGALDRPAVALLTPEELWSACARAVSQDPDLRRYQEVVLAWYESHLPSLLDDAAERELALRLVKLLLVLRLAGLERGVRDLAAALLPAAPDRDARVAALLEKLRAQGSYVAVERREGDLADRYSIDLEGDVNETIRRRARSLEATLAVGDARLTAVAVEACQSPDWPLAAALHARSAPVVWQRTERAVFLALRDLGRLTARELANQAALLAAPGGQETAYVFLAEPQRVELQEAAFREAVAAVEDERWRSALVAWLPREATFEERRQWTADVALELLRRDPTLRAGPAAEAARERLDEDADDRLARLAALLRSLYAEGRVLSGSEARPVHGETWATMLADVAAAGLEAVFPDAAAVAPRRELLPKGLADELVEGFLLPGEVTVSALSVRARQLEEVALPLGVAVGEAGRYRVKRTPAGPAAAALELVGDATVLTADLEARLARGSFGLVADQARLVVAALVRRGWLEALDDQGQPVALGVPFRATVAAVRPVALLDAEVLAALDRVAEALFRTRPETWTPGTQQALFERLIRWREAALAQVADLRAAVARAAEALGHEPVQWRRAATIGDQVAALAHGFDPAGTPAAALAALAATVRSSSVTDLAEVWTAFGELREFVERGIDDLLAAARDLAEVVVPADSPLLAERDALLAAFAAGETVAFDRAALLARVAEWRRQYAAAYAAWHAEVHAAARFEPYDTLRAGPLLRVLGNLSRLAVEVPDGAVDVAAQLRAERARQCRRADLTLLQRDGLVCPECGLRLGETVPLQPVEAFAATARRGVADTLAELRRPARRQPIDQALADLAEDDPRAMAVQVLLNARDPSPEALLAATSYHVVEQLNRWLTEPPAVRRKISDLTGRLAGRTLAKRQVLAAAESWLDPAGALGPDDLITFED